MQLVRLDDPLDELVADDVLVSEADEGDALDRAEDVLHLDQAGRLLAREVTDVDGNRLAAKIAALRIFENEEGKFDRSLINVNGDALVVSQFTLITDVARTKGARPDFSGAARPEIAEPLYDRFSRALAARTSASPANSMPARSSRPRRST